MEIVRLKVGLLAKRINKIKLITLNLGVVSLSAGISELGHSNVAGIAFVLFGYLALYLYEREE